ncbi:putative mitochondrial protein [Tanacetum coccineum]
MEEHVIHLRMVLDTMRSNKLYAKQTKCVFGTTHVEYSGHIILAQRVATDPNKVIAMQKWHVPNNIKQLRGFLGLTGYYRRFIKGLASLSKPLTQLLKKNAFYWNVEAQSSFEALKQAMMEAPVLGLPEFNEPFLVETYASSIRLGAVLQQKGYPIAYLSKTLSPKHQTLSTYEKVFLAVLMALERVENDSELLQLFVSTVSIELMQKVKDNWVEDSTLNSILIALQSGFPTKKHNTLVND